MMLCGWLPGLLEVDPKRPMMVEQSDAVGVRSIIEVSHSAFLPPPSHKPSAAMGKEKREHWRMWFFTRNSNYTKETQRPPD